MQNVSPTIAPVRKTKYMMHESTLLLCVCVGGEGGVDKMYLKKKVGSGNITAPRVRGTHPNIQEKEGSARGATGQRERFPKDQRMSKAL